jgi:hypothetical protein
MCKRLLYPAAARPLETIASRLRCETVRAGLDEGAGVPNVVAAISNHPAKIGDRCHHMKAILARAASEGRANAKRFFV